MFTVTSAESDVWNECEVNTTTSSICAKILLSGIQTIPKYQTLMQQV